jgi:maleate isomerase
LGYRAKIGLIVPATNTVLEPEINAMAPPGVTIHSARAIPDVKPGDSFADYLWKQTEDIERPILGLSSAGVDVIVFGCTSCSFLEGVRGNEEITKKMQGLTDAKVFTTSTAALDAIKQLDLKKISIATPYPSYINDRLKLFIESNGIKVVDIEGLNTADSDNVLTQMQPPSVAYNIAKKLDRDDLDGVFISCTALRTIEIIDILERDINKPVVTSNQAIMWKSLRLANVWDRITGYGRLLEKY